MEDPMEAKKARRAPVKVNRSASPETKHFRLAIAFIGSRYSGWQKQAKTGGLKTVQGAIEKAARKVLRKRRRE